MGHPVRDHLIEEILLNAHTHREVGVDLIEEYFFRESSLDHITAYAQKLLANIGDAELKKVILSNLSECIVVKAQREQNSFTGKARSWMSKIGIPLPRNKQITRAEKLLPKP